MKQIDQTKDLEYGKIYLVYEYARKSHMGPTYKGVVIWRYDNDIVVGRQKYLYGTAPWGLHSSATMDMGHKVWEVIDKRDPVVYNLTVQVDLVFFELTEDEFNLHGVIPNI